MIIPIGHENFVAVDEVLFIQRMDSAPARAFKQVAEQSGMLINATSGRKARSMIVMRSNHVVLSSLEAEAIKKRFDRLMRMLDKSRQDTQQSLIDKANPQIWE
jgi:extracellular matrix regulatory protein A